LEWAAAPDYASSGKLYVYYTDLEGDIRIDEFQRSADPDIADVSTRRPVLEVLHRSAPNHNGGTVMFGPDGCLWTATGDGGGGNDQFHQAQNLETLLGKLLRIDPNPPGLGGSVCRFPEPPTVEPPGSTPTDSQQASSVGPSTCYADLGITSIQPTSGLCRARSAGSANSAVGATEVCVIRAR
jgi:hypothetical protein